MSEWINKQELLEQIGMDSEGSPGWYGDEWKFIDTINNMPVRSDLISRCELFNRLATIPAPPEANDFKAKIYEVIQEMEIIDRPQEWIPCSERLPEYRKLVLVTTRDLRVKPAYLDSIQDDGTDDWWSIPLDDTDCASWNIVAWMPLPKPWKGEDDK